MWRIAFGAASMIAAMLHLPVMAQDTNPACLLERTERIDLSPAIEKDLVILSGDKCEAETFNFVIKTHDGSVIYETQIHHRDIGTSGLSPEEHYERAAEPLVGGYRARLPAVEYIDFDYQLYIEQDEYERLRQIEAPAYELPEDYYYGYYYIVYDESTGQVVRAIGIGG